MSEPIYLKEIRPSNFRSFGAEARIDLPARPGLTVVAGTNGLGKTSLIEAVEWALTGDVRRLLEVGKDADKVDAALTRRGAPLGSHRVSLLFSDASIITRGYGSAPTAEEVLAVLRAADWRHDIADVGAYLAMTHILSQSSAMRLTARAGDERWRHLSQPAGVDRVDRILHNLDGKTKGRMQKRIGDLERDREKVEGRLTRLRAVRDRLSQLDAALAGCETLTPTVVLDAVRRSLDTLNGMFGGQTTNTPTDAADALTVLNNAVDVRRETVETQRRRVERADATCMAYAAAGRDLDNLAADLIAAVAASEKARQTFEAAAKAAEAVLAQRTAAAGEMAAAVRRRDRLYARRDAFDALLKASELRESAVARLAERSAALAVAREEDATCRAALEELAPIGDALVIVNAELVRLRGLADTEQATRAQHEAAAVARRDIEALLPDLEALELRAKRLRAAAEEAESQVRSAEGRCRRIAEAAEERARLAAELAGHLHEEDTACPLCASVFKPGILLERARTKVMASDSRLAEASAEVARLAAFHSERIDDAVDAGNEYAAAVRRMDTLRRTVDEAAEMTRRLLEEVGLIGRPFDGLNDWLAYWIDETGRRLAGLTADHQHLDPDGGLARRADLAATALKDATRRHDEARATAEAADRGLAEVQARLDADDEFSDMEATAIQAAVEEAQVTCARAERSAAIVLEAAATAATERKRAEAAAGFATEVVNDLRRREQAARQRRDGACAEWRSLGFDGEPSTNVAKAAADALKRIEDAVDYVSRQQEDLAAGYRRWLENEDLERLRSEMADLVRQADAADVAGCEAKLSAQSAALLAERETWKRARDLAAEVEKRVRADQDSFVTRILEPLQERVEAFDLAWSTFPELQLKLSFSRERYKRTPLLDFAVGGHDARLILSEGQDGAKSLSYLLSASTAYRWSRWPGLLLDDPLQHNDLIHKTAFLDILRTLIKLEGYQVVMSTHDLDEARFIGRKCRNAGVDFHLCRLLAPGDDGVLFEAG